MSIRVSYCIVTARRRMNARILAVLLVAPVCAAAQEPAVSYSSSSYISAALAALPEVRSAEQNVKIARNSYQNAFITAFLPAASMEFGTSLYDNDTGAVRLRKDEIDSSASVNWNLFNSGRDSVALKTARVSLEQAELALKQLKQSKSSAALSRFYALLSDAKLLVVAQQDLADKERQYALSKRLHEEGFKGLADLLQSENNLKSSQLSLAQSEASRFKALLDFNAYINREPEAEAALDYAQKPIAVTLPDLSSDISYTLANHMDISAAKLALNQSELGYKATLLSNLPVFSVDASWNKTGLFGLPEGASSPNPAYGVAASLSVPLGFFWADKYRAVSSSRSAVVKARDALEQSLRDVKLSLIKARTDLNVQLKKFSLYELRSQIARRKLDIVETNYKSGQATSTDLTIAQNDFLEAQNAFTSAVYNTELLLAAYRVSRGEIIWE